MANNTMTDLFEVSPQRLTVIDSIAAITGIDKRAMRSKLAGLSMAELLEIEDMNKSAALFAVDYQVEPELPLFG